MEKQPTNDSDGRQTTGRTEAINAITAEDFSKSRPVAEADLQSEIQEMVIEFILLGRQRGRPRKGELPD